jgi:hypothetical protein
MWKPDVVVYIYNPSTQEAGHVNDKFEASLGCIPRPFVRYIHTHSHTHTHIHIAIYIYIYIYLSIIYLSIYLSIYRQKEDERAGSFLCTIYGIESPRPTFRNTFLYFIDSEHSFFYTFYMSLHLGYFHSRTFFSFLTVPKMVLCLTVNGVLD